MLHSTRKVIGYVFSVTATLVPVVAHQFYFGGKMADPAYFYGLMLLTALLIAILPFQTGIHFFDALSRFRSAPESNLIDLDHPPKTPSDVIATKWANVLFYLLPRGGLFVLTTCMAIFIVWMVGKSFLQ